MKRFFITFIIATILTISNLTILAQSVATFTAQKVAAIFYDNINPNSNGKATSNNLKINLSKTYTRSISGKGITNCIYVFNIDNGYVVVAGDQRANPILGYSTESNFNEQLLPEGLSALLDGYANEIAAIIENDVEVSSSALENWQKLQSNNQHSPKSYPVVSPLLEDNNWQQNNGYNYYCPADANGPAGHAYVGCVALAMGQVIHYWEYPEHGVGSHSYVCNFSSSQAGNFGDYGTLSANFGATTYNYSMMPNYLTSSTPSNQILPIAKLLYHCGVAVEMIYGPEASMAFHDDIGEAMETYFNYDNTLTSWRNTSNIAVWDSLLKSDLDLERPIIYCAYANEGGHEFVCDGYDSQNYFHFNWGWGGLYNGYFMTSNLNPSYVFNNSHGVVMHIRPKEDPGSHIAEISTSTFALYPNPANEYIHITCQNLVNATIYNSMGQKLLTSEVSDINVSQLAEGYYFIICKFFDGSFQTKPVVIRH